MRGGGGDEDEPRDPCLVPNSPSCSFAERSSVLPLCVWEGKRGRGAKYCAPRAELSSCRPTYQQRHEREHQREHD